MNFIKIHKGFTLIELRVVVAIIGILAAVGVVAYNGYTTAAKNNAVKQMHKQIAKSFINTDIILIYSILFIIPNRLRYLLHGTMF